MVIRSMTALSGPMPTRSSSCCACVAYDDPGQALVQLIDLPGELLDALGQHVQRQAGGPGHRVLVSVRGH